MLQKQVMTPPKEGTCSIERTMFSTSEEDCKDSFLNDFSIPETCRMEKGVPCF